MFDGPSVLFISGDSSGRFVQEDYFMIWNCRVLPDLRRPATQRRRNSEESRRGWKVKKGPEDTRRRSVGPGDRRSSAEIE